jgi:hypothetical protein
MHGLGDIDPQPANDLLEEVGWDVTQAFASLRDGNQEPAVGTESRRRRGVESAPRRPVLVPSGPERLDDNPGHDSLEHDLWELAHMRMQQEEYDRMFAEEDRAPLQPRRRRTDRAAERELRLALARQARMAQDMIVRPTERQDLHEVDSLTDEDDLPHPQLSDSPPGRSVSGIPSFPHRRRNPQRLSDMNRERHLDAGASMNFAQDPDFLGRLLMYGHADDFGDEVMGMHELLNVLMRTQDEADLQAAMQQSSEEAYSGGFSVPPVDEAVLNQATTISVFSFGDAKGQCSICLCEFEEGDTLRTMECSHCFHMGCVDQWLVQSGQCPVCKKRVTTEFAN